MAEITWYSRAPTVPLGYATGWALIHESRAAAQKRSGFSLREFHDRLLSQGSVALPWTIQRAFGAETWELTRAGVFR